MAGLTAHRCLVGFNRRLVGTDGLECVALGGKRNRVTGSSLEDSIEALQRLIVTPGLHALDRVDRHKLDVIWLLFEQACRLAQGSSKLHFLAQRGDVINSHPVIVGCETGSALEKKFSIVKHTKPCTNVSQQTHRFDMMWHLLQHLAANFFCLQQLALRNEVHDRQQGLRQ